LARKRRIGTVLKDKNDKTVLIGISWLQPHKIYTKSRRKLSKFVVHDEDNLAAIGDRVLIEEVRPVSKTKRWRVVEILEKGDLAEILPSEIDSEAALTGTEELEKFEG